MTEEKKTGLVALTEEQRAEALRKASELRSARAAFLKDVKAGKRSFAELLDEPIMQKVRVSRALRSVPGVGQARAAAAMLDMGIADSRRIGGLGARQREALVARFCGGEVTD